MNKGPWSDAAARGLSNTTSDIERLKTRVTSGAAELWRCEQGWLVTEIFPNLLWIWCYEGSQFLPLARSLSRIALRNGLQQIGWFTFHVGARRLFRDARPLIETTAVAGEFRYTLNCEALCALPKTLADPSPSRPFRGTMSASAITTHLAQ